MMEPMKNRCTMKIIWEVLWMCHSCSIHWKELAVMYTGMLALFWTEDILVKKTYTTWTSVDMSLSL